VLNCGPKSLWCYNLSIQVSKWLCSFQLLYYFHYMFQTLEKWGYDFQTSFNQSIYSTYPSKINHGQQMKNNETSEEQFKCIFLIKIYKIKEPTMGPKWLIIRLGLVVGNKACLSHESLSKLYRRPQIIKSFNERKKTYIERKKDLAPCRMVVQWKALFNKLFPFFFLISF